MSSTSSQIYFELSSHIPVSSLSVDFIRNNCVLRKGKSFGFDAYFLESFDNARGKKPSDIIFSGDRLIGLMKMAARGHTGSLHHSLLLSKEFQLLSQNVPGILTLNERLKLAAKKAAYLGKGLSRIGKFLKVLDKDYWQEALLNNHPSGSEILDQFQAWERDVIKESFEFWLSQRPSDFSEITYLDENSRKNYLVEFVDGKIYKDGQPFCTDIYKKRHFGQKAIYTILPDGNLYIGPYILNKFHHSSFNSGQPVVGAGEIKTDLDGKILEMSSKSGHYKPCAKQLLITLQYLEDNRVDLNNIKLTENSIDDEIIHDCAETYLSNSRSTTPILKEVSRVLSPIHKSPSFHLRCTPSPQTPPCISPMLLLPSKDDLEPSNFHPITPKTKTLTLPPSIPENSPYFEEIEKDASKNPNNHHKSFSNN